MRTDLVLRAQRQRDEVLAEMVAQIEGSPNPLFALWGAVYRDAHYNDGERDLARFQREARYDSLVPFFEARSKATKRWSWAVPSPEALDLIAQYSPRGVAEIGAGAGYWAAQLAALGCDVIASDARAGEENTFVGDDVYFPVLKVEASAFAVLHPHRTLLSVWPSYSESWAADAVEAYWRAGGHTVAYVGETWGGCCGDDRLHELLGEELGWRDDPPASSARFRPELVVSVPQWEGIHDVLIIAKRVDLPMLGRG